MNRIVKWVAVVIVLATTASFATAQQPTTKVVEKIAIKVVKKIPLIEWAKWASDQADEATRQRSKVIARAVERRFTEKGRLVSGTTCVDVFVDQTDTIWRGSVKQQITMPCTATLAIDLDKLLENTTFNLTTNAIEVYLPPLSIIAVENHTSKYTTETEYSGCCQKWYDSHTATKLEVDLLKSDWGVLARKQIDPNAHHLREVAKNEATRFLRGLLEPINPDLKIIVNP